MNLFLRVYRAKDATQAVSMIKRERDKPSQVKIVRIISECGSMCLIDRLQLSVLCQCQLEQIAHLWQACGTTGVYDPGIVSVLGTLVQMVIHGRVSGNINVWKREFFALQYWHNI